MEYNIIQDAMGTHIDWKHEGVTPKMIDWFWSNMEKGFMLWHPNQHQPLTWAVPPKHGSILGSIHLAPQTWKDGTFQNIYIRAEDVSTLPAEVQDYIIYDHCITVAGIGFGPECIHEKDVMGYRIHQWQKTDYGVVGKSSAIGMKKKETPEMGMIWADHCLEEIGNWAVFLPQLYNLYKVVTNPEYNPFADLTVEGTGRSVKYKYMHESV